jgi:hypothetical protein
LIESVVGVGAIPQADAPWLSHSISPASLSGVAAGSEAIIHEGFAELQGRY